MKITPDWFFLQQTQTLINAYGVDSHKLRFVGGAVRDSLLGIDVSDIDVATILTPEQTVKLLEKASIRTIPTGLKHGTITAHINGKNFEITTLRRDTVCDGRHAAVEFTTDWEEDARRRDFTMNALYMGVDGEIFDYFGGIQDAQNGHVKFIANPRDRVQEDYLRILRFFRFYAWYGKDRADVAILDACRDYAKEISSLSGERIQQEMLKLLSAPYPLAALSLMQPFILEQVLGFKTRLVYNINNETDNVALRVSLLLFMAACPPLEALEILTERWRLSGNMKKKLLTIINNIGEIKEDLPPAHQKKLLRRLGREDFASLVTLKYWVQPKASYETMLSLAETWEIPTMPVSGKDLLELGVKEGKEMGEKLQKLETLWEESDYTLTKDGLLKRC